MSYLLIYLMGSGLMTDVVGQAQAHNAGKPYKKGYVLLSYLFGWIILPLAVMAALLHPK